MNGDSCGDNLPKCGPDLCCHEGSCTSTIVVPLGGTCSYPLLLCEDQLKCYVDRCVNGRTSFSLLVQSDPYFNSNVLDPGQENDLCANGRPECRKDLVCYHGKCNIPSKLT